MHYGIIIFYTQQAISVFFPLIYHSEVSSDVTMLWLKQK